MKKKKISLMINVLIIVFELISFFVIFKNQGRIKFEYYTEDSNILALFSSFIFVLYMLFKKKIPKWVSVFKYISTICLAVTFFVVLLVLIPMSDFDFYGMLIKDMFIFQHLICPILAMISFVFFDELCIFTKKDTLIGISLTIIYSIVLSILNIIGTIKGPYKFLMITDNSLFESIAWYIIIVGIAYTIAVSLRKLYTKYNLIEKK